MKVLIFLIIIFSMNLFAGEKGNGGDIIRSAFLATGERILKAIESDVKLSAMAKQSKIDTNKLKTYLTIDFISVSEKELIDNTGSVVDALGSKDGIILDRSSWRDYVLKSKEFDKLVLHELLRADEIDDDNFIISKKFDFSSKVADKEIQNGGMDLIREVYESMPLTDRKRTKEILNQKKVLSYKNCSMHFPPDISYENSRLSYYLKSYLDLTFQNDWGNFIYNHSEFGLVGVMRAEYLDNGQQRESYIFPRFSEDLKRVIFEVVLVKITPRKKDDEISPFSISIPTMKVIRYDVCELEEK